MTSNKPEPQPVGATSTLQALARESDCAVDLTSCTISPEDPIQTTQIQHRLNLLATSFGTQQRAKAALGRSTVVEIGCGQGDMTITLAHMVSTAETETSTEEGRVVAIDPAPLDYGHPHTLGDAQGSISRSKLGKYIEWIQQDPIEYLATQEKPPDYIFLVHSLFYLPSAEYLTNLLRSCRLAASRNTRLVLAEWGMQYSVPEAEAHVLAVKVQMESPISEGNVQTVLEPEAIKSLAQKAGWELESENWIREPVAHDGAWEVGNVRKLLVPESTNAKARELMARMEDISQQHGNVKCMDVWTSIWKL